MRIYKCLLKAKQIQKNTVCWKNKNPGIAYLKQLISRSNFHPFPRQKNSLKMNKMQVPQFLYGDPYPKILTSVFSGFALCFHSYQTPATNNRKETRLNRRCCFLRSSAVSWSKTFLQGWVLFFNLAICLHVFPSSTIAHTGGQQSYSHHARAKNLLDSAHGR